MKDFAVTTGLNNPIYSVVLRVNMAITLATIVF